MKIIALIVAGLLLARTSQADELPVCDRTDAPCLIRQSLTLKYRLDAALAENQMLQKQNLELKENPSPTLKMVVFVGLGVALAFGSVYTASKVLR